MSAILLFGYSNYSAKAIARIQSRGMKIDTWLWDLVQEHKAAIIADFVRRFDPGYGTEFQIFNLEGEWSYQRFERWLASRSIAWPRLESGALDIRKKTFRMLYHMPGVENIHELRDAVSFIRK